MLSNMNYDNSAQVEMLAAVGEGASVEEAAQGWIDENGAIWESWLP